jgi:hypothetical protein
MHRRSQFSLTTLLLVVTCCALALGWWSGTSALRRALEKSEAEKQDLLDEFGQRPNPGDDWIREAPMTISASETGDFAAGQSWNLSVNAAGNALLTVGRKQDTQSFQITKQQLDELREAIIREQFFDLSPLQGEIVPDGSTDSLTIAVSGSAKTVEIAYLMNWANYDQAKLTEPARALRVWTVIRNWFEHPQAVDLRKYDQIVLDAAAKTVRPAATVNDD